MECMGGGVTPNTSDNLVETGMGNHERMTPQHVGRCVLSESRASKGFTMQRETRGITLAKPKGETPNQLCMT